MTQDQVRQRMERLHGLTMGLLKERAIIMECDDPLLYCERRDYVRALDEAVAGVEGARVTLAKALARMEGLWNASR